MEGPAMQTILVIDDTALAREAVARLLEYEGFRALRAANGKDAYAALYQDTPDLILLDLMMPEMDGVTFLRMLRKSPRWENLPVIVLTGAGDDNHLIDRAKELHIDGLIPKATFGFQDLLDRVKKVISTRSAVA
jgi:CheY-like chemotaxis protein